MKDKDVLQNAVDLAVEGLDDFNSANALHHFEENDVKKVKVVLSLFEKQSLGELRRFVKDLEVYIQYLADKVPVNPKIETDLEVGMRKAKNAKELLLVGLRNEFKPFAAREKVYDSGYHDGDLKPHQSFLDRCILFLKS